LHWRRAITRRHLVLADCHRRHYGVLHGVCGPKRTAPPPPCAAALVGAACIPHGGCEATAHSESIGTVLPKYQERLRRLAAMAENCVPCAPAFELLKHTVQGKCGVCVLELYAADLAVVKIFVDAFAATAQHSQRSQALADNARRGQCGDVRAVGTRGTHQSTLHVPTDPTEGYTDGAATRLRQGGARSGASV
jgi:hypothetical protein